MTCNKNIRLLDSYQPSFSKLTPSQLLLELQRGMNFEFLILYFINPFAITVFSGFLGAEIEDAM